MVLSELVADAGSYPLVLQRFRTLGVLHGEPLAQLGHRAWTAGGYLSLAAEQVGQLSVETNLQIDLPIEVPVVGRVSAEEAVRSTPPLRRQELRTSKGSRSPKLFPSTCPGGH